MKLKRTGIDCHAVKEGNVYEAECMNNNKVKVKGKDFIYTFTYDSQEELNEEWRVI